MRIKERSRVAVTGLGAICSLGHNVHDIWQALLEGRSGVHLIEKINTERLTIKIAGEVRNFEIADDLILPKDKDKFDTFIHFGLHSTAEALKDAQYHDELYPKNRLGCILGVGMGGFRQVEAAAHTFIEKGERRISPFFVPGTIPNLASGLISIKFGFTGPNFAVSSACASGSHAIIQAAYEIAEGRADLMVTGATESVISALPLAGFHAMKALSKRAVEPHKACCPFNNGRDGFVMGEGAGILILENYEKAKARGATIYAELVGVGANSDAYHIAAPEPGGQGAADCMRLALESAEINPTDVGYINAHGTSTPLGDVAETKAIKSVFGEHAYKLRVSSTKSMTAHLLGAAGAIESVFCVKAIHHKVLPPTINLDNPDSECDLNYVANKPEYVAVEYALNNSFGFGGTNASLIFKRPN